MTLADRAEASTVDDGDLIAALADRVADFGSAIKLRVLVDLARNGPETAPGIAGRLGYDEAMTSYVLRALAANGLVRVDRSTPQHPRHAIDPDRVDVLLGALRRLLVADAGTGEMTA